jgi:plasmid stability protein
MATLTIRNVPEHVAEALRALAARNGWSMEEQVRRLLAEQVVDRMSALERIDEVIARQQRPTRAEEIDEAIDRGRS